MGSLSERKALFIAMVVAGAILSGTFGLARLMRTHQSFNGASTAGVDATNIGQLAGDAETGKHLFLMNCAHCHGDDARGDEGPDLHDLHKSDMRIHQVITSGIKGEMPSFARKLNDADIRALTAYLRILQS